MSEFKVGQHTVDMTKKNKLEIKLGATVRLRMHSGEIVEGRVVYL
jgi:hypothetical protein